MPHSLKSKIKSLCYKGDLSEKERDRIIQALEQQPCEDCVSRVDVKEQMLKYGFNAPDMTVTEFVEDLPSVIPSGKRVDFINVDVLNKIKAEIEQNAYPIVHGVNNHELGMTLYGILQVIDKYKESEQ